MAIFTFYAYVTVITNKPREVKLVIGGRCLIYLNRMFMSVTHGYLWDYGLHV